MTGTMSDDLSPVAILAGNGNLPLEIGHSLRARDVPVLMLGMKGEADERLNDFTHEVIEWEKVGRLFKTLEKHNIKRLI